jgi:predicted DNA-binding protein
MAVPGTVHTVGMLLAPELLQQVQEAAAVHGVSVAAWLRHALHQIAPADFPTSWRSGEATGPSHESGYYFRKYQLRLDKASSEKLEQLSQHFDTSAAEVIRQLIAQAKPEDFPQNWQLKERQELARGQPSARNDRFQRP